MAVAWSESALGSASKPMTVRDPAPAQLSLPRFLAPGDKAAATLSVNNVESAAGVFKARLSASGAVSAAGEAELELSEGARSEVAFQIEGVETGVGEITLDIEGPGGAVAHQFPIQVRPAHWPVTRAATERQAEGETFEISADALGAFLPGDGEAIVSYSPLRGVQPAALLAALWRYPYGCSEQLVSTALPLLYADKLSAAAGEDADRTTGPRVAKSRQQLVRPAKPGWRIWIVARRRS